MTRPTPRTSPAALRRAAPALLLAIAAAFASAPALAAAAGDHYALTLTYDDMVAPASVGEFVLGAAVSGHPGTFAVTDFSVVIGPAGYAYDYDIAGPGLAFDTLTGQFGTVFAAHAFTTYGDQLDLLSGFAWKTDDFVDPHPICGVAHCDGFHYGDYSATAVPVPEPGGVSLTLAGIGVLAAWARRRRSGLAAR